MSENEQQKLNPQVMDVEIGIRELRSIKIYPLSMKDQLDLTDLISTALSARFASDEGWQDLEIVAFIVSLLKENLNKILTMVSDEDGDKLLSDISNLQAAAIAEAVYETNYGIVAKNFKSLFGKLSTLFPSGRPLPQSANDTDTDSTTSTESPGETAELPLDN